MKRNKQIKAIIFDVGGVLALGENSTKIGRKFCPSGVHEDIAKKLGISIDQYLDAIDKNYALAIEGKISRKKVLQIFSKNLNAPKKKLIRLYLSSYRKHFVQNKPLFKQAFKLKKQGYKIAVLSDQWYLSQDALMSKQTYNKFDIVFVSCEQGMRKPNPIFYKLLLRKLKISSSESLFIDNQLWNIKPAKKLGLNTILFKDNKTLFKNKLWSNLFS
ncbi:MAG: HAD family phosphatase [archaeon]|jgi:epoxide hydrolase-like predicted phosphatase